MTRPTARPALLAFASLLPLAFGTAARAGDPAGERTVAITNAMTIDVTTGTARPDTTVLVRGDRIVAVIPSATTPVPPGTTAVDGRGMFLVPGHWDMNANLAYPAPENLFPRYGVTGARPMFGVPQGYYSPLAPVPAGPARPRGATVNGRRQVPTLVRTQSDPDFGSVAPPRTEPPAPPPAQTLPLRTVTPAGLPVPIALTLPDLEAYKAAAAGGRKSVTDRMAEDGIVHVVTAPTPVRYERTWRGHAYVRTLDGPLMGRLLVMEAGFLK